MWKIADREGCSERTVMNWIDRSMAAILREFGGETVEVKEVEEFREAQPYALSFAELVVGNAVPGVITSFGKVWVQGVGFMRNGRPVRDGRERIEQRKLYADRPR